MTSVLNNEAVLKKLRSHEPVSATWAQLASNISAEILAETGFEVLVIDMEHSPVTIERLISMLQGIKGTGCVPFVRAPWNDMVWIKQILDAGVCGVHIPYVSTKEEAEYAVKACKYAKAGFRGIAGSQRAVMYGMDKADYYARANSDITVMVAIETERGVNNIDEIASVDGVDGIFIGPADLSTDMGHLGHPEHPEVQAAMRKIEAGAKKAGKFLGTVAADADAAEKLYDMGYSLVYFFSDSTGLVTAAKKQLERFKENRNK